jgi:hypothetical protein
LLNIKTSPGIGSTVSLTYSFAHKSICGVHPRFLVGFLLLDL